jgi:undecaprenyl-diphosphatase
MAVALWTFGAVLALMLAMPTTARWMQTVDDGVYRLVIENEITILVTVGEVLAFIGSARFMAPFIMAVAVILAIGKRWGPLWVWTLAIAISQLFNTPVKMLFARDRPPLTLVETTGYAFPSGHALTGAVVAVAMVIALVPAGPKRRAWWTIAVVYALVMAWSRVYVRAHWLSDVTAGLAVGAAAAISAALLIDLLRRHTRR